MSIRIVLKIRQRMINNFKKSRRELFLITSESESSVSLLIIIVIMENEKMKCMDVSVTTCHKNYRLQRVNHVFIRVCLIMIRVNMRVLNINIVFLLKYFFRVL